MIRKIFLFLLIIFVCMQFNLAQQNNPAQNKTTNTTTPDYNVALKFLNGYIELFNNNNTVKTDEFLKKCGLVTKSFISKYLAYNNDDDLLFDPVVAAEEFPKEFVLVSTNPNGYVVAKGIGGKVSYKVTVKLILLNSKWLVDGSGVLNIPKDKQLK
ncbi:MAG: hypothetical protein U0U67_06370 [Chitinophagales bacterium]